MVIGTVMFVTKAVQNQTPIMMVLRMLMNWHSVPTLIASAWARPTGASFGESECRRGDLGTFEGKHLMTLALAHAGRLAKFGA